MVTVRLKWKVVQETFCQNMPSIVPVPYTEKEVKQTITYKGKSSDKHGICAETIRHAQHTVVPALTKIFNKILQERNVPIDLKFAILTPCSLKEIYYLIICGGKTFQEFTLL